ncbi:cache domain-containing protein [Methylobacterium platani]|uniref:Transcriptional regulator n=2 Tax=Methylobacterium platani TaxID=427683 RepID=A0A179S6M8_9HYPH|nr:cache domain-containing protein [Methylobacterium platani]KMO18412.1 transcriptional regulator [Methylobacterium platani JCM 14648]OAS23009.1 transcriptional regulator [Methylobacterium platani]
MVKLAVDPRRSLFSKYCLVLFAAVALPLFANGGLEAWFGYRDRRAQLHALLGLEARDAALRIGGFLDTIREPLGWMVQLPWTPASEERQRLDALRLLRQVPAIAQLTLVDGNGRERLQVSRVALNRAGSGADLSGDPAVAGARSARAWYGPVIDHRGSEPFMTVALAGNRASIGVVLAEINLKLIRDVISGIRVGATGQAFVLDGPGRLIAHPDLSLVLRGADDPAARRLATLRETVRAAGGAATGVDGTGRAVIAAAATIPGVDWTVVVMQPAAEAFGPIARALLRTGALILLGLVFAAALAYGLARHMTGPIRLLEHGTERIGAGDFRHRIAIASADELGRLAARFNAMAGELALSQERQERIARLRRFLAPQVAELVDRCGDDGVLDGRRLDVAVIFGDLRGFTAFSALAPPEVVIEVLGAYFAALGGVITAHGATLVTYTGDGLMALVNAPVPTPDPGPTAVRLARAMQEAVRPLAGDWTARGFRLGFGVGAAMGPATVGRIGCEGRSDYTAIGPVVNLAARLCAAAADAQILIDATLAEAVRGRCAVAALGALPLKGFGGEVPVFGVADGS